MYVYLDLLRKNVLYTWHSRARVSAFQDYYMKRAANLEYRPGMSIKVT